MKKWPSDIFHLTVKEVISKNEKSGGQGREVYLSLTYKTLKLRGGLYVYEDTLYAFFCLLRHWARD